MSYFLDRLTFLAQPKEEFSKGHGVMTSENRKWEEAYRGRWAHDKIVRSTHGVNCTGSCSWKIYVKNGLITWETQQTDYPRTRPDMPNHEPRGCARGASYSWYIYSANRLKYPMIRKRLLKIWREAKKTEGDPVKAWAKIQSDPEARKSYQVVRGMGGFVRAEWEEVNEIIAASNIHTIKKHGPDRVCGFSPIPAMSMVSYAAGSRYLSLIGGVCMSFYDWYCDLPPSSPQTWGEQTDVPESADWYNSSFIIMWGSNVPQTRTPDAHFMTEVRYKGTQVVTVTPDYSEASKFADIWLHPKQGTDAALGMAMGHVILKEFHLDKTSKYFDEYCRTYSDMPFLVMLEKQGDRWVPGRMVRASDFSDGKGEANNPDWKTVCYDEKSGDIVVPTGSIGFRWGEEGKWNIVPKDAKSSGDILPRKTLLGVQDEVLPVGFAYFGNAVHEHGYFETNAQKDVLIKNLPVKMVELKSGKTPVVTVFDLLCANYGLDRGLGGEGVAKSYDDNVPYTPAWQEKVTGVPRDQVIRVARAFADTADKTKGKSMIIIGAAMNHWYHMDMNYRACINMLVFCGCVGQSGGGWAHYVGQEKLRPQMGWAPLAFALDWARPPRQQNSTSFWYAHTDQWRYETLGLQEIVSPLADKAKWKGTLIDCNIRSERMGWLPSAPQMQKNPLDIVREAEGLGKDPVEYTVTELKSGGLRMSCEDPDHPDNWPRNLFVWRSNLLGSSGKGHEYFLKHLLGTQHGVQGKDLGTDGAQSTTEAVWHDAAPEGKLDLLVTLDFRMSTTCVYSDIVLPTASWYEKNDLNTSDMHPFIHPLSEAIAPVWQSRSDWEIYKGLAKKFSELAPGHLGVEKDLVLTPIMHDTAQELAQPVDVKDWKRGECEPVPGKTMPSIKVIERDYPATYERFTTLGPLMEKLGNGGKGIAWNTAHEVDFLKKLNGMKSDRAKIESDIDACEVILSLAPETNGEVAVKSWASLSKITGRDHTHLAKPKEEEKLRFRDLQAQPRKIISAPTWSGLESEHVSYNAGYTNVHEFIPWRTLTGRQQLYQDHEWMRAFGETMVSYRPPINTRTVHMMLEKHGKESPTVLLNWITPHQKWGIHSTYTDNLHMLTLSRGGPIVWMSETDAKKVEVKDNDWVEVFNTNGAIVARAVVSQRVNEGMMLMYHAQEKLTNMPGSQITQARGGIHNSVTRATVKPTHMIGGYAQQSYGFNYYGTVGSNRDEFVIVRRMDRVDWMDEPAELAAGE